VVFARAKLAPEVLVRVESASLRFGRHQVLENVDLEVRRDEIVTLIGPNGSGKSTLVKVLLGLLRPQAGRVTRAERLRSGYLPQRWPVDSVLPITVARVMTLTSRHDRGAVEAALAETGVAELVDAPLHSLSGGELQRVLLARALLRAPDLLVLDEPMQGVDFAGEAALYKLISEIRRRRGCGVLLVSHDLHVVMAATDRVVCLNHHVCCAGAPEAVSRHPAYRDLFGEAAPAFAVYSHHHDHRHDLSGGVLADAEAARGDGQEGAGE
jgi:zinc transport system ATP-binding protein